MEWKLPGVVNEPLSERKEKAHKPTRLHKNNQHKSRQLVAHNIVLSYLANNRFKIPLLLRNQHRSHHRGQHRSHHRGQHRSQHRGQHRSKTLMGWHCDLPRAEAAPREMNRKELQLSVQQ
jgi:hypothetical protein